MSIRLNVLIDTSVLSHGQFARTIGVEVPGWGNSLALIEAKKARPSNEIWLRRQIESLPTVARMAKEECIVLHSYSELDAEFDRGGSFPGGAPGDAFAGVPIKSVAAPLDRAMFYQVPIAEFVSTSSQIEYCTWLLKDGLKLLEKPKLVEKLNEQQIFALQNLPRYREICSSLVPAQYVDALHLWTGELNSIDVFLTMDRTFRNALGNNRKIVLRCTPLGPCELLDKLEVTDRDPLPFEYGRRYLLNGVPYE